MTDVSLDEKAQTRAHARSYHAFTLGLKWVVISLAAVLVFLTVSFATPAGWGWGLFAALMVLGVGVWAMNHGLSHSTETNSLPAL